MVNGEQEAVNPAQEGTKAGLLQQRIAGGGEWVVDLRLARQLPADPFDVSFDQLLQQREQRYSIISTPVPLASALMTP